MNVTPNAPGLKLTLDSTGAQLSAHISRQGTPDLEQLALGRTPDEVLGLLPLLFPVCPMAHQAAFLAAVENALKVELPPGQVAARKAAVLGESISTAVWRGALHWPTLLGKAPMIAPVRRARDASDRLTKALYEMPWAQFGGAELRFDFPEIKRAFYDLKTAVGGTEALARSELCPSFSFAAADPLGQDLFDVDLEPFLACREETPRSMAFPEITEAGLADWFRASADYTEALVWSFHKRLPELAEHKALGVMLGGSGAGLGIAVTARGRLRHCVVLEDGHIARWSVTAPTDWNFAPDGPVARAAQRLEMDDDLADQAKWLVAAFDPCLPCAVELRHA